MSNQGLLPIEELHKSALRELCLRRRVYPRWVSQGRISQEFAEHEIEAMAQIVSLLHQLVKNKKRNDQPELFT